MRAYLHFIRIFVVVAFITVFFQNCAREAVNIREMTLDEQLAFAKKTFDKEDYEKAKIYLNYIVMNNPGGTVIENAQFYLAESYYYSKEYILAIEEYQKLIKSLAQSAFVDDAVYMVGMCYYKMSPKYALDQEYTQKAIMQFRQFIEDFPDSELKGEAEQKLIECRKKLAKKEYKTGELYRKMGYYKAAIISFNDVFEEYHDTEFADDALYWTGECHRILRQWIEAERAFQSLLNQYPDSMWISRTESKLREVRIEKNKEKQEVSMGLNN